MTITQQLETKGLQKGLQKGEKNTSIKIARQLIVNGVERAAMQNATGLNDEEWNVLTSFSSGSAGGSGFLYEEPWALSM